MLRIHKLALSVKGHCRIGNTIHRQFAHASPAPSHEHHHDEHPKAGPYDPKHAHFNQDEAFFPGMSPDYKYRGWEIPSFLLIGVCSITLLFGGSIAGNNSDIKAWARREALAREEAEARGVEIEFGKWYQYKKYEAGNSEDDTMPILKEDDE